VKLKKEKKKFSVLYKNGRKNKRKIKEIRVFFLKTSFGKNVLAIWKKSKI